MKHYINVYYDMNRKEEAALDIHHDYSSAIQEMVERDGYKGLTYMFTMTDSGKVSIGDREITEFHNEVEAEREHERIERAIVREF
jgi:hypothetical protein